MTDLSTDPATPAVARPRRLWKALGPGILFAGAAVGVSHLVQSTRAGAEFGLALIGFVIIANLMKYPAFRIGNQYAAATGHNLLIAYKKQGRLALGLFVAVTLATMFVGAAAVSITVSALAVATFNPPFGVLTATLIQWSAIIALLYFGRFKALDTIVKALLSFLTVSTVIATILVFPMLEVSGFGDFWPAHFDRATLLFIAALVGWMPAPLDTSVWQSLWSQAKTGSDGVAATMEETAFDYNVGFVGTAVLACCFVVMGAGVMHGTGESFAGGAAGFAAQVISLYERALGPTVATLVGMAAMAVVFSTALTAIDAWPRTLAGIALVIQRGEDAERDHTISHAIGHPYYWIGMAVLLAGAFGILAFMMGDFSALVDVATTISFLSAPIFAWMNHRAMFGEGLGDHGLGGGLKLWSLLGVIGLGSFALFFLVARFALG